MGEVTSPGQRIAAIHRTRRIAAEALVQAFHDTGGSATEYGLCAQWSAKIAADPELLSEGWYQPPPNGVSALIGVPPDFHRMQYFSLRDIETWPRDDINLTDDCLIYAYSSPVDRATWMIGDLGVTLYNGADENIWDHLAVCFDITARIASFAEVGMELRELYHYASELMKGADLANQTFSTTDPSKGVDVGHTLPWSYSDPDPDQAAALASGDYPAIASTISRARLFVNEQEKQRILPTMGFTVEPRMARPGCPLASFHVLVTFLDGVKSVTVELDSLLALFNMAPRLGDSALVALGCSLPDSSKEQSSRT